MLDFANRPPHSPHDVDFSESGEVLLRQAVLSRDPASMIAYGRSVRSEIVDSFKGHELDEAKVRAISKKLVGNNIGIVEEQSRHTPIFIGSMPESFANGLCGQESTIVMGELRAKNKNQRREGIPA